MAWDYLLRRPGDIGNSRTEEARRKSNKQDSRNNTKQNEVSRNKKASRVRWQGGWPQLEPKIVHTQDPVPRLPLPCYRLKVSKVIVRETPLPWHGIEHQSDWTVRTLPRGKLETTGGQGDSSSWLNLADLVHSLLGSQGLLGCISPTVRIFLMREQLRFHASVCADTKGM